MKQLKKKKMTVRFNVCSYFGLESTLTNHMKGVKLPLISPEFLLVAMKTGRGSAKKDKTEALKPTAENKKVGKRKAALRADKNRKKLTKREKSVNKDLKNPKRPLSAFFIFLEEFRKVFKQEHPNVKAVSAVGKAGGEKWKSMTAEEKAPFEAKAAKRKAEYQQLMTAYNRKQENTDDDDEDDESDHSKSEFSNDEETVEEEEDYDDDD